MMKVNKQQLVFLLLCLTVVFLLLISSTAGANRTTFQPLDFTPTVYIYLPFISKASIPPDDLANEQSIANLLNQQRNSNGLLSLSLVPEITQAARRHSRDMADHNFTSHTGSDGSDGGQRMQDAGYNFVVWAEIIGWGGGGNTQSMVNWWMNSPGHRSIILSNDFEDFGVGYAKNSNSTWGHYWTVNFGKRTLGSASSQELYVCTFKSEGQLGGSSLIISSLKPCQ